jgi:F0F1-type ATP synthase delta subunit
MQTHKGTVELVEKVDPAILGGLSIQAGHRLLDTSVRAELHALKQSLFHSTIS